MINLNEYTKKELYKAVLDILYEEAENWDWSEDYLATQLTKKSEPISIKEGYDALETFLTIIDEMKKDIDNSTSVSIMEEYLLNRIETDVENKLKEDLKTIME